MDRRRMRTPEEIVAKPRQVEVLVSQGKAVSEAVRAIAVSEATRRN
jgi:putative transposase